VAFSFKAGDAAAVEENSDRNGHVADGFHQSNVLSCRSAVLYFAFDLRLYRFDGKVRQC
jgi:hypothetical protein